MPESVSNGDSSDVNGASCSEIQIIEENTEEEIQYDPILPLIDVSTNEEDETELIKLRAKLYRYDSSAAEWKERGTGEVKLLRHNTKNTVRVVMRRDKTLKICANHFVTPWMELKPNCNSDRAWVWSVLADFADELLKPELLAIRFANSENARAWKEAFDKAKKFVEEECEIYCGKPPQDESDEDTSELSDEEEDGDVKKDGQKQIGDESEDVTKKMEKLDVTNKN